MNVQFVLAALAAIGGAWLIWQSVREHRPAWLAALGAYGFVVEFQPDAHFSRVLTAYGGVFGATDARSRPDRPLNGDLLRARSSSSAPAAAERTAGVTITCDRQDRRLSRHLT